MRNLGVLPMLAIPTSKAKSGREMMGLVSVTSWIVLGFSGQKERSTKSHE
jgi:hypothetical protein